MALRRRGFSFVARFLLFFSTFLCGIPSQATSLGSSGRVPRSLVLGSGGFLGQRLVAHLESKGYAVAHVIGREHVDLRSSSALLEFERQEGPFNFVFFIACEVGGAKFLEKAQSQPAILRHNVQMYETVFPWAKERDIPVLFTSSYMRFAPGVYGAIKLLGEEYMTALLPPSLGQAVRLWNLYGPESVTQRSHVISDWAAQCVRAQSIASTTDGLERRQFLHVDDAAAALVSLFEHWDTAFEDHHNASLGDAADPGSSSGALEAPASGSAVACDSAGSCVAEPPTSSSSSSSPTETVKLSDGARRSVDAASGRVQRRVIDLSSGTWHRLRDVASLMSAVAQEDLGLPPCPLSPAPHAAQPRPEVAPDRTSRLHAAWHSWMAPTIYPIDAPITPSLRHNIGTDAPSAVATDAASPSKGAEAVSSAPAPLAHGSGSGPGTDAFGWISLRDGIAHVLRHHMALLASERNA